MSRRFPRALMTFLATLAILTTAGLVGRARVGAVQTSTPAPVALTTEHRVNPLGIDAITPRLSWQSPATSRDWTQSAYQILVASSAEAIAAGSGDVWDSGKRLGDESIAVSYAGPALESGRRYYWSVRVWDAGDTPSGYAEPAWWEMGLLDPTAWEAEWISRADPAPDVDRMGIRWIYPAGPDALRMPVGTTASFRLTLTLAETPSYAALYLVSRGDFVARVNGTTVSGKTRSWVAFDPEDITRELVTGVNTIDVTLTTAPPADVTPPDDGRIPSALAGLVKIIHADGTVDRYPTNAAWGGRLDDAFFTPSRVVAELDGDRFPDPGPIPGPAALLRRAFTIGQPVRSARLYATALGSYRMLINGERVGDDVLTPEFTDYRDRVLYQTYDVTDHLQAGENVVGAMLAGGWFASPMSWYGNPYFFGPGPTRLLAQIVVTYEDGTEETIGTDDAWMTDASPILLSEIYGGEVYDARREQDGWAEANFDDGAWTRATVVPGPLGVLAAQSTAPARITHHIDPISLEVRPGGVFVFDLGQNIVGAVTLRVDGPTGTRVRLRFAEMLSPDGGIYRDNLRNADATDVYVLAGGSQESYTPAFTFHGFRYVEVTGFPGMPTLASLTGEVMSSVSGEPTGRLSTSSDLVNQFWEVGVWGQRGNFLSVPTDCPQRDERLGWTGDAGVFWRTGAYNFDIAAFTTKWLADLRDAQSPEGSVPNTVPHVPDLGDGAPGWGDAAVIVPWTSWIQYGDARFIDDQWESMERWMTYIHEGNPELIRRERVGWNFSDWLAPDERTDKDLVATAYWALIADQMVQMADATGRAEAAARYRQLHGGIRTAFQEAFLGPDGRIEPGTQTSYLLTLNMRLAPEPLVPRIVDHLVAAIDERDGHLSTGFLGTPFLLFALADHGRTDLAYQLLLNATYPSWGYMVSNGATTWWERWNSDSGDPAMNSYNHYAFGSVVAWVYRYVAGIDTSPTGPGFKDIVIHPRLDARLTHAEASYDSPYGTIATDWTRTATGPFTMTVTIPANTTATVYLPAIPGATVTEGGSPVTFAAENDSYVVRVGSGTYEFAVR